MYLHESGASPEEIAEENSFGSFEAAHLSAFIYFLQVLCAITFVGVLVFCQEKHDCPVSNELKTMTYRGK